MKFDAETVCLPVSCIPYMAYYNALNLKKPGSRAEPRTPVIEGLVRFGGSCILIVTSPLYAIEAVVRISLGIVGALFALIASSINNQAAGEFVKLYTAVCWTGAKTDLIAPFYFLYKLLTEGIGAL